MQSCVAPDQSDRQAVIMDPPSFAEGKKQLLLVFPGLLVQNIIKRKKKTVFDKKIKENFLSDINCRLDVL